MTITVATNKLHWNYFLALDYDLAQVSRYVEFSSANFSVYSIELAHILFAAASEVDVVAKLLCKEVAPAASRANIDDYRNVLTAAFPDISSMKVFVPRYGLEFVPWLNWAGSTNPSWWRSYNNVKHERDTHFPEATLKNSLNALGGLLLMAAYYYSRVLAVPPTTQLSLKDTTYQLRPESSLLRLGRSHYFEPLHV